MKKLLLIVLALSFTTLVAAGPDDILKIDLHDSARKGQKSFNYDDARIKLFKEIHLEKDEKGYYIEGVYCQKKYYLAPSEVPGSSIPNSDVFNTEHTWPQSRFSNKFNSKIQKSDLHHLFPTYSRINSERGNYPFGEVNNERKVSCEASQSGPAMSTGKGTYFEPPQIHKGNVARAMFYFSVRYQIEIDPVQEEYFRAWHREDPVDAAERARNEKIAKVQGNRNPFIDNPEFVNQISDF